MALQRRKRQGIDFRIPQTGTILKLCLFVSLLLHVFFVFAFQKAFPLQWGPEALRTYEVELVRPPVEDLNLEGLSGSDAAQLRHEKQTVEEKGEDTISLDTDDERYVSYAAVIKQRILGQWMYPKAAKDRLIEGKLTVVFTLGRDGRLTQAKIPRESGFEILDEEAVRAIRAAAPFPAFPEHIRVGRLNVMATFDYRLTRKK